MSREAPPSASARAWLPGQRARVLVIDDEPLIVRLVERLLRGRYDVEAFTDSSAALARVRDGEPFDLALCDLMMRPYTGAQVYESVEHAQPDRARRIAFLTGGAVQPWAVALLDRVENLQIEKPFMPDKLLSLIAARLEELGPAEAGASPS